MKPGEAATLLGIGRSTVTTWTMGEFRQYFTENARGGEGRARHLSDRDVQILHFIDQMKKRAVPSEEIHIALRTMQDNDWRGLPPMPEPGAGVAQVPVVPKAAAETALTTTTQSLLREIEMYRNRLQEVEDALDSQRMKNESLLREIGDLRASLAEAKTELRLYQEGRLKPDGDKG